MPNKLPNLSALIEEAQRNRAAKLDLSGRGLTKIPESIGQLIELQYLDLSTNRLATIPESIGRLSQLQTLSLDNNHLTLLPEFIGQLIKLQSLALSNNQLTSLPESIGQLTQLQRLYLDNNQLTSLPESLRHLRSLERLYLHENNALGLPAEVLGPTWQDAARKQVRPPSPDDILEYYFRVRGEKRPLNEAKVILLGRGAVGKTSIVNRLVDNVFKDEQKTEGIKITKWGIRLKGTEDVRLNIWDFGGQEIMHATHQFFLTQRSLYLLVLNGREGGEDVDAEYWLKLIESFGGESPVIVVLNKIKDRPFDVNRRALQQKYPFIRDFIKTDCKYGIGLEELRSAIERETDRLEHLRDSFPASWVTIKERLAGMKKNYLGFEEYRQFCNQNGETDKAAQEALASYLNTLGIALNFKDDPRLQDTHVLNPHWVTNGIYKILNSEKLEKQKGEIRLKDFSNLLDGRAYPAKMHRFLLDLMRKFDLCFSFPDDDTYYLIPELLEKQEPVEAAAFKPEECLNFQYHYPVLIEGLLPRFIVRTHTLSEGEKYKRWRTGVILEFEGCRALVKADVQDKKVFIHVAGPASSRRRLLAVIRSEFERIHRDVRNLHPLEMVPLPMYPNVVVPYQELLVMEKEGEKEFKKVVDNQVMKLNVNDLLNGVDLEGTRRRGKTLDDQRQAVRLFCSYSHKDENLRNELDTHLKLLQRQGLIENWNDRRIEVGDDWKGKIDDNLERAGIILLLVSSDFIASDYCYDIEIARALERERNGEARVIPVIVRDVNLKGAPFAGLQYLPKDGLAVTKWTDKDSAWRSVAEGLERIIRQRWEGNDEREESLFIAGISLKNIRCFENLGLSFRSGNELRKFILLFGDNGVGKTTLLRSIALGLCDKTIATALMEMLAGPLLREKSNRGQIKIDFINQSGKKWSIETVLRRTRKGMVVVEQNAPPDFPRDRIFVCGYGAGRLRFGTQDYAGYSPKNSLGTLFNYDSSLQNPELAFRRTEAQQISLNELTQRIDAVLMLQPGDTTIDSSGIRIRGPWGDFTPLGGLGDGFQATLGWIADLFGWALFYAPDSILNGLSGIVLLDEIEQHLHPSWQREIIKLLHQQFPGIQFIGTSHSPMCALGTTALPESVTEIVRLRQMDNCVEATPLAVPKSQRADQVLTSPLFGLFSASGFDVSADIEHYAKLASLEERSNAEQAEFNELGERLESILGPFRSELERRIDGAVREAMHKELEDVVKSGKMTNKALDLQIRHRIRNFLG
jgi:internalin A